MNIVIAKELINSRLKNNLGRYNSRSLNEKWFIKNNLEELYRLRIGQLETDYLL